MQNCDSYLLELISDCLPVLPANLKLCAWTTLRCVNTRHEKKEWEAAAGNEQDSHLQLSLLSGLAAADCTWCYTHKPCHLCGGPQAGRGITPIWLLRYLGIRSLLWFGP